MDSNTTSGANVSTGSRIRYLRHPTLLLTRAADEERNLWSSSSRHPGAAVARKTRAIGRELLRTVMTLLLEAGVPHCPLFRSTRIGGRVAYRHITSITAPRRPLLSSPLRRRGVALTGKPASGLAKGSPMKSLRFGELLLTNATTNLHRRLLRARRERRTRFSGGPKRS